MAIVDHEIELTRAGARVDSRLGAILFFVRRYPLGAIGALIMIAFVATAVFADAIATYDPLTTSARASLAPPGDTHTLGADFMGRDVLSRIIYGARISLAVGLGATALGCLIGMAIGLMSGFFGGWFDLIVQRLIDIMQSLPLLVMALVMAARPVRRHVGKTLLTVVAVFGIGTVVLGITRNYAVAFLALVVLSAADMVSVFMPTGIVPPTGFVCFVPRKDVTLLDMSMEDAAKVVISGGMVMPETQERLKGLADGRAEVAVAGTEAGGTAGKSPFQPRARGGRRRR